MSGIFDLFGGTENSAMTQSSLGPAEILKKSAMNPTMFGGAMAAKNIGASRSKPKGLSIRPSNVVNVSSNLNVNGGKSPKCKSPIRGVLKPDGSQHGFTLPTSPRCRSKTSKMQIMKSKQLRALSAKTKSPERNLACENKQAAEWVFKKPSTPQKPIRKTKVYRDPEILAGYYDPEKEMNDFDLDTELIKLLKLSNNNVKPFEDEGFDSDPETVIPSTLPAIEPPFSPVDDETPEVEPRKLPTLSDDEDFWDDC